MINVLIAVNDSEISLTRPKMENERERGYNEITEGPGDAKREGKRGERERGMFKCLVTTPRISVLPQGSLTLFVAAVHCTDAFLRASHFVFIASAASIFISAFVEFFAKQAESRVHPCVSHSPTGR